MHALHAPEARGVKVSRRGALLAFVAPFAGASLDLLKNPASALAASRSESPLQVVSAVPPRARAPFALPDLEGQTRALADLANKVTLVHFFATWCEPCRREMESLGHLADAARSDIAIVAISVAEPPVRVRKFFASSPVPFPVVLDADRSVSRAWEAVTLPTTFVLDRDLRPRLVADGEVDWMSSDVRQALEKVSTTINKVEGSDGSR